MSEEKIILKDIIWSFVPFSEIGTQAEFEKILYDYHKDITGRGLATYPLKEVVVNAPEVVIQYLKWDESLADLKEERVKIESNNDKNFTAFELLFKIHNAIHKELEDDDLCYFEGLMYGGDDDPEYDGIPLYFMIQGS